MVSLNALLEVVGTVPTCMTDRYVKELPWLRTLLTSTKIYVRELAAKIHAIIVVYGCDANEFESRAAELLTATKHHILETQHGALVAVSWMLEKNLMIRRQNDNGILEWATYGNVVKMLCEYFRYFTIDTFNDF